MKQVAGTIIRSSSAKIYHIHGTITESWKALLNIISINQYGNMSYPFVELHPLQYLSPSIQTYMNTQTSRLCLN